MHVGRCGARVVVWAPAKVNLFLEILARHPDGYHEIETLITAIGIYDTLYFAALPQDGNKIGLRARWGSGQRGRDQSGLERSFRGQSEEIPEGDANLVVRAVRLLQQRAGIGAGARMYLTKRIPSAAGLGGASSDAAAALVAANLAWNLNWPVPQLMAIGAQVGSDVPFFIQAGAAVCRGRGERVEPIGKFRRLDLVVVRPADGLSTASVYGCCLPADRPKSVEDLIHARSIPALGPLLFNGLAATASRLTRSVSRVKEQLRRLDLVGHEMSGSGTSCFGVCRHARQARRCAELLRARRAGAVWCVASAGAHRKVLPWGTGDEGEGL